MALELYGSSGCQFTAELREHLEFEGEDFVEFDVDDDAAALKRMLALTGGNSMVPVLVNNGRVERIGWHGRGCYVSTGAQQHGG